MQYYLTVGDFMMHGGYNEVGLGHFVVANQLLPCVANDNGLGDGEQEDICNAYTVCFRPLLSC